MFEAAEIGSKVDKETFAREEPALRIALLAAQRRLAASPLRVVIVVGGIEGAGKSETVNLLLEWLDARGIRVHAPWTPSDEENERPPMWRFWRILPPSGSLTVLLGSWYTAPIIDRAYRRTGHDQIELAAAHIVDFERMLHREDTLVLKFWMHLAESVQRKRLKKLERDPEQSWRVSKLDWKFFRKYDRFRRVSADMLRRTSTAEAPWHVVEAADARHRNLTVARTLLAVLEERLAEVDARPKPVLTPDRPKPEPVNVLSQLDLSQALDEKKYDRERDRAQGDIARLTRKLRDERRSMLLVFEGPDAAGKGGAIRRLTSAIDARSYEVVSIAAPSDEERARPYLWRFWRQLPRLGRVTIFDRSWYGRVLVERIEGFCQRADWTRAYGEINAFEEQLTDFGIIVRKFWLQTSAEEQLRRFRDRQTTPYKQYKLTEEDWRNRQKWDAYVAAACDMIARTSTPTAPWVLVEADDKNWARVKVLKEVARTLEKALD